MDRNIQPDSSMTIPVGIPMVANCEKVTVIAPSVAEAIAPTPAAFVAAEEMKHRPPAPPAQISPINMALPRRLVPGSS